MVPKMFCTLLETTLRKCFHLSFICTLFFSVYCMFSVFGKREPLKRFLVEEGVKPSIFGSYSYDPARQVFIPPPPGNSSKNDEAVDANKTPPKWDTTLPESSPSTTLPEWRPFTTRPQATETPQRGQRPDHTTATSYSPEDITNDNGDDMSTVGVTEDKTLREGKTNKRTNTGLWGKKPTPSKLPYRMQII